MIKLQENNLIILLKRKLPSHTLFLWQVLISDNYSDIQVEISNYQPLILFT